MTGPTGEARNEQIQNYDTKFDQKPVIESLWMGIEARLSLSKACILAG
jgi:hypothetical protein